MKKRNASKMGFLPNTQNKYSIRKFTVGTASILVGSLMFLGSPVSAAENDTTEVPVEVSAEVQDTTPSTEAPVSEEVVTNEVTTSEAATTETPVEVQKPSTLAFNPENTILTGMGTTGDIIVLTYPNGTTQETTVNEDGSFEFTDINIGSEEAVTVFAKNESSESEIVTITSNKIVDENKTNVSVDELTTEEVVVEAATVEVVTEEMQPIKEENVVSNEEMTTTTVIDETTEVAPLEAVVAEISTLPEEEAEEALTAYVAQAANVTEEEAQTTVEAMDIDSATLTSDSLLSALLTEIADEKADSTVFALAASLTSASTEMESVTMEAAAVTTALAIIETPTINTVGDYKQQNQIGKTVSGTAAPNSTVKITVNGKKTWTVIADANGLYSLDAETIYFNAGDIITVTATDSNGIISPIATTKVIKTPTAFSFEIAGYQYYTHEEAITGYAEPGYTVDVIYNETGKKYTGVADANGIFSIPMSFEDRYSLQLWKNDEQDGTKGLTVAAYNALGENRLQTYVQVQDTIPLQNPLFYPVTNIDDKITGTFHEYQGGAYLFVQYPDQTFSNPIIFDYKNFLGTVTSIPEYGSVDGSFIFNLSESVIGGEPTPLTSLPAGSKIYFIGYAPGIYTPESNGVQMIGGYMDQQGAHIDPNYTVFTIVQDVLPPVINAENAIVKDDEVMTPIPVTVTDETDKEPTITSVTGLPSGVVFNTATSQIEGTPNVSDWAAGETSRDFTVVITANDDAIGTNDVINTVTKTITITVTRADAPPVVDNNTYSIGNYVWMDMMDATGNYNNLQDASDRALEGIVVILKDLSGNILDTYTTKADGYYRFDNVKNGEYRVSFVAPDLTYQPVISHIGASAYPDLDSDGPTDAIVIVNGADRLDIDQGYINKTLEALPPADTTAPVVDIQPVREDATEITVVTEPNTEVTVTWPDGTTTVIDSGSTGTIIVPSPVDLKTGDVITAVSKDEAGNKAETTETVTPMPDTTAPVVDIQPVREDATEITVVTEPNTEVTVTWPDGTTTVVDSGSTGTVIVPSPVDLKAGDVITAVSKDEAGNKAETTETVTPLPVVTVPGKHSLGNYVWVDNLENPNNLYSMQDSGDAPLAGVRVDLYDYAGNFVGFDVTDASGHYQFDNLIDGTYIVRFVEVPAGYTPVVANIDSDRSEMIDSDGPIDVIAHIDGKDNMDVDQGYWFVKTQPPVIQPPVTEPPVINPPVVEPPVVVEPIGTHCLGDFVWIDANGNSLQDIGEKPLAGVKVTLRDYAGNTVGTTYTDANGHYYFDNLADGTYIVNFMSPDGYSPVIANIDSDRSEMIDSDGPIDVIAHIDGKDNMDVDQGFWIVGGGSETPVTPAPGGGTETPVTPVPGGGGSETPVTPAPGGGGSETPVTPAPGGGGSETPVTPAPGGGGTETPVTPSPGGGGTETPVTPSPGGGGTETPVTPSPGGGGTETPVTPAPGGGGTETPVTPAPGEAELPPVTPVVNDVENEAPATDVKTPALMEEEISLPDTGVASDKGLLAGAMALIGGLSLLVARKRKEDEATEETK